MGTKQFSNNMNFLTEIYNWLTPTIIIGGVVTYWFGKRQKRFDINQEHYKKIRLTVSDLLSIWNEYAKTERFLKSNDPTNIAIYQVPELAKQFFNLDLKKLKKMNKSFLLSIENLKEIDILLFYKLKNSLEDFNRTNKEIFIPLIQSRMVQNHSESEVVISIMDELMETIEQIILNTVKHLPRKERIKVKKLLNEHLVKVKKQIVLNDPKSEVPEFMVNLINKKIKPKTPFTQEDFQIFYSNETIHWIMSKVLNLSALRKALFSKSGGINLFFAILAGEEESLQKVFSSVDENEFQISKKEASKFIDNKAFYQLIMGIVLKVEGNISMKLKRELVKMNSGQTSLSTKSDE
ncbi:MAG: hypothetical protein RI922_1002 [Bacteroidota bacterium]|jgi:hypothetical protein